MTSAKFMEVRVDVPLFLEFRNLKKWRNKKTKKETIDIVKLVEDIKKDILKTRVKLLCDLLSN